MTKREKDLIDVWNLMNNLNTMREQWAQILRDPRRNGNLGKMKDRIKISRENKEIQKMINKISEVIDKLANEWEGLLFGEYEIEVPTITFPQQKPIIKKI